VAADWVPPAQVRATAPFSAFALCAAAQALEHARLPLTPPEGEDPALREAWGVSLGSGIGSLEDVADAALTLDKRGARRVSPYFIPRCLANMAAGQVALRHGLKGPSLAPATACATGAHAIGDAARIVARGDAELMVAGGAEAALTPLAVAGFCQLRALSTGFNEDPARSSRPFDRRRDGFVMGEGAAVVVLEPLDRALARGATPICEVAGYGLSGDAHHVTSPDPEGRGAARCMGAALRDAGLEGGAVSYVSAHATSTPAGDEVELKGIAAALAPRARARARARAGPWGGGVGLICQGRSGAPPGRRGGCGGGLRRALRPAPPRPALGQPGGAH